MKTNGDGAFWAETGKSEPSPAVEIPKLLNSSIPVMAKTELLAIGNPCAGLGFHGYSGLEKANQSQAQRKTPELVNSSLGILVLGLAFITIKSALDPKG